MATSEFQLSPTVWDPTWSRLPEPEESGGLKRSQPHAREDWVVRLRFKQNGDVKSGTGFYLNVPSSKSYVILTAAHNLIDEEGNKSEELHVERRGKAPIPPECLNPIICPDYRRSLTKGMPKGRNAGTDYGVILTPKASVEANIGFGFALKLSQEDLRGVNLELSGYLPREEKKSDKSQKPEQKGELTYLDAKSGPCWVVQEDSLEYDMVTAQGLSGSPVYMPYKGHETVVAIHNNGPERLGKGSKGARLSCKTIQQIFDWVGLSSREKFLRATESKDIDPLYLHFLPGEDYAWVHLTRQGLDTSFDVFPAYAPTSRLKSSMLYVFRYVHHTSTAESIQRWVLWDVAGKGVTLTEVLQDYCFPRLVTKPSAPDKFWVVLEDTNGGRLSTLVELRMDPTSITHWDRQMGELDGPGVSFLNHRKNKVDKVHYNRFLLE